MRIALVHDAEFPVTTYGGTERVVWWLARGLAERGHAVTLVCRPGSRNPFGSVAPPAALPGLDVDLVHFFHTPERMPERPHVVTIEGNGKPGEEFLPNTIFVSRNHARRHQSESFVYNGVDPAEYRFRRDKDRYVIFLGKAAWRVKNVRGAMRIARRAKRELRVLGGSRLWKRWRGVSWEGMVGGDHKARLIAGSSALVFPVRWNEPFGIAVIEALVSGSPVLASPFGSLPELVSPEVGILSDHEDGFVEGLSRLHEFPPDRCREYALEHFTYAKMTEAYLERYERVLSGETLNAAVPRASEPAEQLLPLPRHAGLRPAPVPTHGRA